MSLDGFAAAVLLMPVPSRSPQTCPRVSLRVLGKLGSCIGGTRAGVCTFPSAGVEEIPASVQRDRHVRRDPCDDVGEVQSILIFPCHSLLLPRKSGKD